jgi:hypothetical protein
MPGIVDYDCEGVLTISSISMNRAAWAVLGDETGRGGLVPLWVTVDQRGDDRVLPHGPVIPYLRRNTATRHDLRLLVTGDVDLNGAPLSNSKAGLYDNLAYIYTNIVAPTGTGDGTRVASLTVPGSGGPLDANIHVLGLVAEHYNMRGTSAIFEGTLQISVPVGKMT